MVASLAKRYLRFVNYLAHCFLSGEDDDILAGNYMGDFIKGNDWKKLPGRLGNGVVLHRLIDSFTDEHPETNELMEIVRPCCGRYAGIAIDMIYDHLLASRWDEFHGIELLNFTTNTYQRLEKYIEIMPPVCQRMFSYMSTGDWMYEYRRLEGLHQSLSGLERRIGRETGLPDVVQVVENERYRFDKGFERFFPEIQRACSQKLASFGS